jgi:hypothetical protein
MKKLTMFAVVLFTLAVSVQAIQASQEKQEPKKDGQAAANVTGKWSLSIETPQGPMTVAMVLKQEGSKVTGTLAGPQGETALEGQFVDGTLTFGISFEGGGGSMQLSFSAKLAEDGSLAGVMSGPMGEIPWTAVRVKD